MPVEHRVACFDNDGTLWCEKPDVRPVRLLRRRAEGAPSTPTRALAETPEFAALITGDQAAIGEIGLERIAYALTGLFDGHLAGGVHRAGPRVHGRATHPTLGRPLRTYTTSRCSS